MSDRVESVSPSMRILSLIAIAFAQLLYEGLKLVFPRRRKVVFLSRQSNAPSRDFAMLADAIGELAPGVEVVTRCRFLRGEGMRGAFAYAREVLAQMRHLADASVCVVDGYVVPVSVLRHRRELFVLQTWHALGAIKKFGYQALDRPGGRSSKVARVMRMHRNYDLVLCGGPASVPTFAEAFDVPSERVRPLGLPRIDYLLARAGETFATTQSEPVRRLERRAGRLLEADKQVVLYAPTFRSGGDEAWRRVAGAFDRQRFTVIVKPHDLDGATVDAEHVVDARGTEITDLLPLCDAVITDYSAVAFEGLVIGKPVYFYVYDIDEYSQSTGLNLDPRLELPDATSQDINEIADRIATGAYNTQAAGAFSERYVPHSSGGCTRRIAETIVSRL